MNEPFVKEYTFRGKWEKSETFRVIVLFLVQHQGETLKEEWLVNLGYKQNRLPKYKAKRESIWKDRSGLWWKGKKRTIMIRTREDLKLLQEVGILVKTGNKFLVMNNLDIGNYLK